MKTKVKEVVNEPTFKGYGRLIFLVDIKIEDDLTLQNIFFKGKAGAKTACEDLARAIAFLYEH